MNSSEIESLLNLTLEIEGLLMLAQRRDEMTPTEVYDMLTDKAARLINGVSRLERPLPAEVAEAAPHATVENENAEIAAAVDYEESNDAEPFEEPEAQEKPAPTEEPAPAEEPAPTEEVKGGKDITLTLNDKFRFRRSIFEGSDARMAEALAALSAIHDRAEIEDYIANDLCRDLDDPEVQDFIDIIEAAK